MISPLPGDIMASATSRQTDAPARIANSEHLQTIFTQAPV
jgi:hypothetical protein